MLTSGGRTFVLVLATGDEALTALANLARDEQIANASPRPRPHVRPRSDTSITVPGQVLSFLGDIALDKDGKPSIHAHAILGARRRQYRLAT